MATAVCPSEPPGRSQATQADSATQAAPASPFAGVRGYRLPVFSAVVAHALAKVRDRSADAGEVARVLEADPGVSVKLLRLANSASYGLTAKVESAAHAIALLGRDQVESLLMSVVVAQALPDSPLPELDAGRFWVAAARRATFAKAFAQREQDPRQASACFTAALLQDMAVPFLAQVHGAAYGELLTRWRAGEADLTSLEQAALGHDHAQVGAWMCREWKLPEPLASAIGSHHHAYAVGGQEGASPTPVQLVAGLTDDSLDQGLGQLADLAAAHYGLTEPACQALTADGLAAADELARLFTT